MVGVRRLVGRRGRRPGRGAGAGTIRTATARRSARAALEVGRLEVLVDLDHYLAAVRLPHVRLVGRAVRVGLDAQDRPTGHLVLRRLLDLVGGVAGKQLLAWAVPAGRHPVVRWRRRARLGAGAAST